MKKVYCKNCNYRIKNLGEWWCKAKSMFLGDTRYEDGKKHRCFYYEHKWWKFWAKKS